MDPHLGKREYRKCSHCRLIFLSPEFRLEPQEEKARYDLHQNHPEDTGYIQFLKKLADPLSLKLRPGFCGLDFGCGAGSALGPLLEERGCSVSAYDPYYFPDRSVLQKKVDFVACSETIEHFYNPRRDFLLMDELLKEDESYLGLMTQMLPGGTDFSDWWYHREPTHVAFYQKETFEWMAAWRGWSVEFPSPNVIIYSKSSS